MSAALHVDRIPSRRKGVWLRTTDDESVLLDPDGHRLHVLNDTALALWELCDGSTALDEMVAAIVSVFAVDPGTARQDVTEILDQFTVLGILAWCDPSPADGPDEPNR